MKIIFNLLLLVLFFNSSSQPVTGVWRGKIINGSGMFANTGKVELKIIKNGDSLVGTCYYYNNSNSYMRYGIRGYFDSLDNTVHWRDDKFLGIKPTGKTVVGVFRDPMVSQADFNCPGNNVMKLDGNSQIGEDGPVFTLHFDKVEKPIFHDEWDNVIEGYFTGMADPAIIDSVYAITKPYEPAVPQDVAKKLNPVIPGQQKLPESSTTVETTTAATQNLKTPTTNGGATGIPQQGGSGITPATIPGAIVIGEHTNPTSKETAPGTAIATKPKEIADTTRITAGNKTPVNTGITTNTGTAKTVSSSTIIEPVPKIVSNTTGTTAVNTNKLPAASTQHVAVKTAVTNPSKASSNPPPAGVNESNLPPPNSVAKQPQPLNKNPAPATGIAVTKTDLPVVAKATPAIIKSDPVSERMFVTRKKVNQAEIPVLGDSVELNFYDNAEIDGDSISLFLNGKLLFNHVLLSAQAYTFKIPVAELPEGSELTMVAENLGSIPPNTAFMMAIVNGERYTARIESTEQTSGVIKLIKRRQ